MNIYVCVGSACHQRSSYAILKQLKELITENRLDEAVSINAAFCLGHCADGVTIKVDEELIPGVRLDSVARVFSDKVLAVLR